MADSPGLAADEKLCPYCAETIKRAAIRCRYCHSDLATDSGTALPPEVTAPTPVEPPSPRPPTLSEEPLPPGETDVDETDGDEPPPPPTPVDVAPAPRRGSWLSGFRLTIGLLVLCLVLAGVAAFAWRHDDDSTAKADGAITSAQARASGLQAATTLTQKVLSYNWQTLDQDTKAAEAVLAPSFRKEYSRTIAGVRDQTIKNQVKLTASPVATSIVSASPTKVVALVFVNQITTAKGATGQRLDQNRVLVTLSRNGSADGGEWRVSKMKAF